MISKKVAEVSHRMTNETMESFIAHETAKGTSANMLRRFNCTIKVVYSYLPEDKLVTKERLLEWRESMEKKGYASLTIANYVKGINRYLDYVGCSAIRFNKGKAKDITGMIFGYLTAIEPTGEKNRGDIVWRCQCACGNSVELPATRLLLGNTMSCGCLQKKHRKEVFLKANKTYAGTNLAQAVKEQVVSTRNTSGYVGVFPKRDKWIATIRYKGIRNYLGTYCHIEDAINARTRAKKLAIEDAKGLLDFYEELHKSDPELPNKKTVGRYEFTNNARIGKNNEPASAAKRSDNTSGCVGVISRYNRWESQICYRGIRYILGVFDHIDDAVSARKKAEADLRKDAEKFVREYSTTYAHHAYR